MSFFAVPSCGQDGNDFVQILIAFSVSELPPLLGKNVIASPSPPPLSFRPLSEFPAWYRRHQFQKLDMASL